MIAEYMTDHVQEERAIWAIESHAESLSVKLECVIKANTVILEDGRTQLRNS